MLRYNEIYVYTHETIITVKIINISITSKSFLVLLISSSCSPQKTTDLLSVTIDEFAFFIISYKLNQTLCNLFDWLLSFGIIISDSSMPLCASIVHSFVLLSSTPTYGHGRLLIRSPVDGLLGCFPLGGYNEQSAMGIRVQVLVYTHASISLR